jgi:hypothetical protein
MKRLAALALALAITGCGATHTRTVTVAKPPSTGAAAEAAPCVPPLGAGRLGVCVPKSTGQALSPTAATGRHVPDVSEYNPCRLYSEAIVRVYEAGTGLQDSTARCHFAELRRIGAWRAAYAFVRPPGYHHAGSCVAQADRTAAIVKGLGGVTGPVVEDAEVPLPRGFVACFLGRLRAQGFATVTYTSTGTASGGPFKSPLWLASYGAHPGCIEGICHRVAWQFGSTINCRGVYGDCSIDEGILAIRQTPPVSKAALEGRRRALRRVLARNGCRRRTRQHEALGPRCRRWYREGDAVNARLRAAR